MPDAERNHDPRATDWSSAFAALPMEAPPADGWQRIARALDAPTHRARARTARWPAWLAVAATLSAVALVPVLMRDTATPEAPTDTRTATRTPAVTMSPPTVEQRPVEHTDAPTIATAPAAQADTSETVAKTPATSPRKRRPSPTTPPHESEPRRLVAEAAPAASSTDDSTEAAARNALAMQSLQSESAQLEALVALARDERVASANAAALTAELDERIGRIDASLSQPTLGDADRLALWQERVTAMRELAGIETTQRWLTARGERYDGALVSID
ncbi:hypothetical protein [Lysobacter sp.]|uniref:hypothetical protein n=1 Tax=Lysobacter sp. TaxID=72226 RepID=UPI002D580A45|nr:hypothetical protein [Lysobacter sp.]HZX78409.1 hypothetical protein [Lysobacter sp.]